MMDGLQTDKCINASVICGFEHGYHILVPSGANTTFDNSFMSGEMSYRYYNEYLWKGRFAESISMEEAVELLKN